MESRRAPFHGGELEVQRAMGVSREAAKMGRIIGDQIAPNAVEFIGDQQLVVIATVDSSERPCCSAVVGHRGAFPVLDPGTVSVDIRTGIVDDGLADRAVVNAPVGLLFFDPSSRRRYRVNGTVLDVREGRIIVGVVEAYPNCPK